jgi:hypothetical protein
MPTTFGTAEPVWGAVVVVVAPVSVVVGGPCETLIPTTEPLAACVP